VFTEPVAFDEPTVYEAPTLRKGGPALMLIDAELVFVTVELSDAE
jgi:hypothetical protein